jgi:subtilisin-like proprotein convertase family protein
LLAGCGVGSPEVSLQASQEEICSKSWTWANPSGQGAQSSSAINIAPTASVRWELQNCTIQRPTRAQLVVCIDHSQPSELELALYRGANAQAIKLSPQSQASPSGTCESGSSGTPWTYAIDNPYVGSSDTQQSWRLEVIDTVDNQNVGTLVGWSFELKGFN